MAIFHFSAKVFSRKKGESSVAKSAYRSASCMIDERTGQEYDFTKRRDHIEGEMIVPENAPVWASNREKLWNEVERKEKRGDSQVAREIEIALPKELSQEQQKELVRQYVKDNFVNRGMVADVAYHFKEGNPHTHIMLTMRDITPDGLGNKNRDWNDKTLVEKWRESWALTVNKSLEKEKINIKIDHRSYKKQGLEKLPQKHMGVKAHHLEKKGIRTEIGELNKQIKSFNSEKIVLLEQYKKLKKELEQAKQSLKNKYKFKYDDDLIRLNIIRKYKKEFPKIKHVRTGEAKSIFNLNSHIGKVATIKAIYEMYTTLLKAVEWDRKISEESKKILDAKKLHSTIKEKHINREELQKGIFSKMKNKTEIERLTAEIESLEYKLNNMGIDTKLIDEKINELNQAKAKNDKNIETFKKTAEAKKAIDDTKRRAKERQRKRNYYNNRNKRKERGEEERGYTR